MATQRQKAKCDQLLIKVSLNGAGDLLHLLLASSRALGNHELVFTLGLSNKW